MIKRQLVQVCFRTSAHAEPHAVIPLACTTVVCLGGYIQRQKGTSSGVSVPARLLGRRQLVCTTVRSTYLLGTDLYLRGLCPVTFLLFLAARDAYVKCYWRDFQTLKASAVHMVPVTVPLSLQIPRSRVKQNRLYLKVDIHTVFTTGIKTGATGDTRAFSRVLLPCLCAGITRHRGYSCYCEQCVAFLIYRTVQSCPSVALLVLSYAPPPQREEATCPEFATGFGHSCDSRKRSGRKRWGKNCKDVRSAHLCSREGLISRNGG